MAKCAIASVVGGLVYFLLGFVIYGLILPSDATMAEEPAVWAIGIGSIFLGAVLALVLGWRGTSGPADAFKASAGLGALLGLAVGFSMMGTMAVAPTLGIMLRDTVIGALMYGVVGVAVAKVLGEREAGEG